MNLHRAASMTGVFPIMALASACGGGADGGDPLKVTPKAFVLAGTETAAIDLTQRDVVLAAANAALAAAVALRAIDILAFDSGIPEPGAGRVPCDGGHLYEDADDGIGVRDVLIDADQCSFEDADGDTLFDGSVDLFKISSSGGSIEGNVEFGADGGSFVIATRAPADVHFDFLQIDALIDYEGDPGQDHSSTAGGRLVLGNGDVGSSDRVSFTKGIELFAGPGGVPFESQMTILSGNREQLSPTGTLIYRGQGMDAPCNFTGRYAVATTDPIIADYAVTEDGRATGGSLAISSGSANATVAFQSNGDAVVTTSNGTTTTVPFTDVDTHCGLD